MKPTGVRCRGRILRKSFSGGPGAQCSEDKLFCSALKFELRPDLSESTSQPLRVDDTAQELRGALGGNLGCFPLHVKEGDSKCAPVFSSDVLRKMPIVKPSPVQSSCLIKQRDRWRNYQTLFFVVSLGGVSQSSFQGTKTTPSLKS